MKHIAVYPVVRSEKDEAYISQAISFFFSQGILPSKTIYLPIIHETFAFVK